MADIYTSHEDEVIIDQVLVYGFRTYKAPKYRVLRLALAKSLRMETQPESEFDTIHSSTKGSNYSLEQVTGRGKNEATQALRDFDDAVRALLSAYHDEDLFASESRYVRLLQRHVRRGLREIRTSWSRNHSFANWLREELLADAQLSPGDSGTDVDADILREALTEIGVTAEIRQSRQGIRVDRFSLYLSNINHLDTLRKGLSKIAFRLSVPDDSVMLTVDNEAGVADIDIPRPPERWKTVLPGRLFDWAEQPRAEKLPLWLGASLLGDDVAMDLAAAPHMRIAGATGSGKTVCLHSLLVSLLATLTPKQLRLALIDPKGTELNAYGKIPNLFGRTVATSVVDAAEILNTLVEKMESRNRLFAEMGARNIDEATLQTALPRIVLVVEELADLFMQPRELEAPLVRLRLAQKARSAGIHLVLATQRPDSNTFSGLLRSNIPVRIALRVQKHTESSIILDEKGAEALLGKGDMLVKLTDRPEPVRVHGAKIGDSEIARAIKHFTMQ
ncbi:DNA translocase FtsK [Candidatus Methylospira mobilis]|uniref:DNA translocase FtsK n=1 Tax=Candidatus Methylospira mobilis TaxID=1808979 RepID=A0A5Q0BC75_9GAMM|nr:FtsK/SpoIIIE domain-containing protein [Candidatus Methylospira mobilis]QFY41543.1 DNA translocase FtsK [Candidatus Methylospira mobilis]WNV05216.1 FtsK/SpoIIIE domain-containing protein [Candidatus Methylospira mobilis]